MKSSWRGLAKNEPKNENGFTLIEIMVALLIMAGLSLIMAQSVKTGLDSRKKIQLQLSEESLIRDAMRLIVSDIASAFHHRDTTVAIYNKVLELRKKKALSPQAPGTVNSGDGSPAGGSFAPGTVSSGAPPPTTPPAPDPLAAATPLPIPNQLTGFVGSGNEMTFSVKNHVRRFVDARESDQARISYFLRNCRQNQKGGSSQCLHRMETTNPTDEFPLAPSDEDDARGVVLVHNVTEFRLRYIVTGMDEFVDRWDSLPKGSNQETRNRFPDAVEVTLAIHDTNNPASKPRRLSWLAPVRNSNNLDEAEKAAAEAEAKAAAAGTQPPQPSGSQR